MKNRTLCLPKNADIDWRFLEMTLHKKYHIHAIIVARDGSRRTHGEIMWANSLCSSIKANPVGEDIIWSMTQRHMCSEADRKKCSVREECPVGMTKIVVPIMIENDVEGFVCLGGRPFFSKSRICTDTIHRVIGFTMEEIKERLKTVEPIDYLTIKEIMAHITSYNKMKPYLHGA